MDYSWIIHGLSNTNSVLCNLRKCENDCCQKVGSASMLTELDLLCHLAEITASSSQQGARQKDDGCEQIGQTYLLAKPHYNGLSCPD